MSEVTDEHHDCEPTEEMITAFLHARTTNDGVPPGFVFDEIATGMDDDDLRKQMGLDPLSGNPILRHDEGDEFQREVVRRGLRAVLALLPASNQKDPVP